MKKIKLEIDPIIIVAIIVLLVIGFLSGYFYPKTQVVTDFNLSGQDLNTLGKLSYLAGHCERMGLVSSVYVQQDQNGNRYGLPICIEAKQVIPTK